jgi:hypothetical protein
MKVVLGGSRHLSFIPEDVISSLNTWINDEVFFIIGEAKGTDAKIQEYLNYKKYENVIIYFSGDSPRHNFGNWPVVKIDSGLKSKGHAMHTAKDREMTKNADEGLMIWDRLSVGTFSNIIDLLSQSKPCQMFIAGEDSNLYHLSSLKDLDRWKEYVPEVFEEATNRLHSYSKRIAKKELPVDEKLF